MKKYLLFILLSFSLYSFSQTSVYHPFPDSNAVWKVLYNCLGPHPFPYCFYGQSLQSGDTIINGVDYKKIYSQGINIYCTQTVTNLTLEGGLRQDTSSKRIYFWSQLSGVEELLYDFNLNPGDPIPPSYITGSGSVISVDSIQLNDGSYRKVLNCYDSTWSFTPYYSIIEGIGSDGGLFMNKDSEYGNWLCSFTEDTTLLFGVTNCVTQSDTCQNVSIYEIDNPEKTLYVFPNPVTNHSMLWNTLSETKVLSVIFYNIQGKKIYDIQEIESKNLTIEKNNFNPGLYLFNAVTERGKVYTGKFIVR